MPLRKIKIDADPYGIGDGPYVEVDGYDISAPVTAVTMRISRGQPPEVTLDLSVLIDGTLELRQANITVPEQAARALSILGWHSPDQVAQDTTDHDAFLEELLKLIPDQYEDDAAAEGIILTWALDQAAGTDRQVRDLREEVDYRQNLLDTLRAAADQGRRSTDPAAALAHIVETIDHADLRSQLPAGWRALAGRQAAQLDKANAELADLERTFRAQIAQTLHSEAAVYRRRALKTWQWRPREVLEARADTLRRAANRIAWAEDPEASAEAEPRRTANR